MEATKERLERSRAAEEGGDTVQLPTETSPATSRSPTCPTAAPAPTRPPSRAPPPKRQDDVQQRDLGGLGGGTKDSAGRRRGDAATDVINRHGVP
nr:unnamed protein product [Digitaria exilis]